MALQRYREKRHFDKTPEPRGASRRAHTEQLEYVIQKHAARRLHYDFRLELDRVLKSWAVPQGPSLDPAVRSLAVHVEDHPLEYASFEGVIPAGEYGGGTVMVWDRGFWEPIGDPRKDYARGKLHFRLLGERLQGEWKLIRMHGRAGEKGDNWLLIKHRDAQALPGDGRQFLENSLTSVLSQRSMDEIAQEATRVWTRQGERPGAAPSARHSKPSRIKEKPKRNQEKAATGQLDPAGLTNARRRRQPATLTPQFPTLVDSAPAGEEWVHELKFDGYRVIGVKRGASVRLLTRRSQDWSDRFPSVAEAIRQLPVGDAILDGEVVVPGKDGTSDFQALQNSLGAAGADQHVYYVFDLPHCDHYDLTETPLVERKALLQQIVEAAPAGTPIRYSGHVRGQGQEFNRHACRQVLEGTVSKQADSPYESKRSLTWVKVKCLQRQEFVIGGYTEPTGSRKHLGALLLGFFDAQQRLIYCGRVGTGFTAKSLKEVGQRLRKLVRDTPAYEVPPQGADARGVHWVQPRLVAEIQFAQWTDDGRLRQPSFLGLREDKTPRDVHRETAKPIAAARTQKSNPGIEEKKPRRRKKAALTSKMSAGTAASRATKRKTPKGASAARATSKRGASLTIAGVTLSHPERVVYPEAGITKKELAKYFEAVADSLLPHVVQRPLTVLRCPGGRHAECFYQKHLEDGFPEAVQGVKVQERRGVATYLMIEDLTGLMSLVQFNAIEFHPWGSRAADIERPDRLIFDLDPGPKVAWEQMIEAARRMRDRLAEVGLTSFVRTTGGKGLHVVVPLVPRSLWPEIKRFAKALATSFEREAKELYIASSSKAKREGRIFIDYLRNDRGSTAIASYSPRARPGAGVATPLRWDELSQKTQPDSYTVANVVRRLGSLKEDPWKEFFETEQWPGKKVKGVSRGAK